MNFIFLIIFSSLVFANTVYKLPAGFHLPSDSEIKDRAKNDMPKELSINADLDGNGKLDHVKFLLSNKKLGIFLWWNNNPNSNPELVFEDNLTAFKLMAISVQKIEKLKTACGKGYFDCGKNEPDVLDLKAEAINYYKPESANSLFVFDKKAKKFNRIWISD